MPGPRASRRGFLLAGAAGAVGLSLVLILLSWGLPRLLSRDYDRKSLAFLRSEAGEVRQTFAGLLASLQARVQRFSRAPLPPDPETYFGLFKEAGLDLETEGIVLCDGDGTPEIWLGNVLSPADHLSAEALAARRTEEATFILRDKASVYAVALRTLGDGKSLLAHFLRLAFIPQFQSSHVLESHALRPAFRSAFDIDYWDFREDVSGFEKFFGRHRDEFAGEPRQKNEIQTLFFPLRNEAGDIAATVTLSSPSLTSKLTGVREDFWLAILILLQVGGLLTIIHLWTSPAFLKDRHPLPGVLIAGLVAGLRLLSLPLSRLGRVQALRIFSPADSGFASPLGLTGSPGDILLTTLAIVALCACLISYGRRLFQRADISATPGVSAVAHVVAAMIAAASLLGFRWFLAKVVFNSGYTLLRWTFDGSFLSLQVSILLLLAAITSLVLFAFRSAVARSRSRVVSVLGLVLAAGAGVFFGGADKTFFVMFLEFGFLGWAAAVAAHPRWLGRREALFLGFLLAALWTSWSLDRLTTLRTRTLVETTLSHTIRSQESWGDFLMEQSFPSFDRGERSIVAYFKNPADPDFAHSLWEKTLVAKFNWYSSLEIRDAEGNTLSRFSLNVPKTYGTTPELEPAEQWTVVPHSLVFIGKEKDFLIGYRDFRDETHYLGRLILYVAIDPEMLPFLYSANPYFETLRTDLMPSLVQFDVGCAIFDLEGVPLFNPRQLTSGPAPEDLARLKDSGRPFWSRLLEKGTVYDSYLFASENRCYSLFIPQKSLKTRAVEFLGLFFFQAGAAALLFVLLAFAAGRASLRNPLWSFSNRVYAAFLAIALVPLLLYTVFTRNLFDRIMTERFVQDAAIHASYAQGLLEAFLVIQGMEVSPYLAPSEDLALWISQTLSNDVNLYSGRLLLASSRREFFDSGLLPEILDGEAYHSLVYAGKPFTTKRTTIGGYSFQTLTVPYSFKSATLFISLPFPFEQQELARATREIVEFLVLLAAFFAALVVLFSRGIRTMIIVPVRKLLAGTREVGLGNLEVTIEHRSRDEMMTLIDGFNTMIKNLKAHEQELAEMSKKVAWTEMARKVAHEIKNPLTPIQLSAEHVLKVFEDKKGDFDRTLRESMSYIISEVENLRRIAQDFMEISRDTDLRKDPLDLRAVLDETLRPYRKLLPDRIQIRTRYEGLDLRTRGDASKLKTAFRNIVANAVEAISQKGEVAVTAAREGSVQVVVIRDSGPGMSRETLDRIFDPYFSTKDSGTGLGLPIAKKIIEEHGGSVRVESEPGRGTAVTVELPVEE